eukprot:TRINITY_DN6832_c0_g5_i1.p1 TRINITY_DN6832_c0_g5~~TRINITY_DN6832_c0_g5_i1.p1  ORF type:complete len:169 (-),score=20.23 TRINITY_DN6832_c0_g5_i1:201-707(-)
MLPLCTHTLCVCVYVSLFAAAKSIKSVKQCAEEEAPKFVQKCKDAKAVDACAKIKWSGSLSDALSTRIGLMSSKGPEGLDTCEQYFQEFDGQKLLCDYDKFEGGVGMCRASEDRRCPPETTPAAESSQPVAAEKSAEGVGGEGTEKSAATPAAESSQLVAAEGTAEGV